MLEIDGSQQEGGGQVLRTSLALSALLRKPVKVFNIRANRPNPGLRPQHLTAVQAMQKICSARVEGENVGAKEIVFEPGEVKGGKHKFDVGTAGSLSLLFQAMLPALAFAGEPTQLELVGGTHVAWSPPADFISEVFLPAVARFGVNASFEVKRLGWYPKGGGIVEARVEPLKKLKAVEFMERGTLSRITGKSIVSNLPRSVAERQKTRALKRLVDVGVEKKIEVVEAPAFGKGTCLFLRAEFDSGVVGSFSGLGEIGKPAERVADEAVDGLLRFLESSAAVDEHLGDQLVPLMILAEGVSRTHAFLTPHLLTNIWVTEQFLGKRFQVEGKEGEVGLVSVEGTEFFR